MKLDLAVSAESGLEVEVEVVAGGEGEPKLELVGEREETLLAGLAEAQAHFHIEVLRERLKGKREGEYAVLDSGGLKSEISELLVNVVLGENV